MQVVRFRADAKIRYGALEANYVVEYSGTPFTTFSWGRRRYPLKQIATDIDPSVVMVETYVNGERRQSSSTKELIFPVEDIVARVSQIMTLLPGDVIATRTPPGVGPLRPGDRVEVRIEGIGSLKNTVVKL